MTSIFITPRGLEQKGGVGFIVSAPSVFKAGISGSLHHLEDGTSYLNAGENVTITTGSTGQITISSTGLGGITAPDSTGIVGPNYVIVTSSPNPSLFLECPSGLALDSNGNLWVSQGDAFQTFPKIFKINPGTGQLLTTIDMSTYDPAITYVPQIVASGSYVMVCGAASHTLFVFDINSDQLVGKAVLDNTYDVLSCVVTPDNAVWVNASVENAFVSKFFKYTDVLTLAATSVSSSDAPMYVEKIVEGGGYLWGNEGSISSALVKFNYEDGTFIPYWNDFGALSYTIDIQYFSGSVWVTDGGGKVFRFDPTTWPAEPVESIQLGLNESWHLANDGTYLYVSDLHTLGKIARVFPNEGSAIVTNFYSAEGSEQQPAILVSGSSIWTAVYDSLNLPANTNLAKLLKYEITSTGQVEEVADYTGPISLSYQLFRTPIVYNQTNHNDFSYNLIAYRPTANPVVPTSSVGVVYLGSYTSGGEQNGDYSTVPGGLDNTLDASRLCIIGGGYNNYITNSTASVIVGAQNNIVQDSVQAIAIGAGNRNRRDNTITFGYAADAYSPNTIVTSFGNIDNTSRFQKIETILRGYTYQDGNLTASVTLQTGINGNGSQNIEMQFGYAYAIDAKIVAASKNDMKQFDLKYFTMVNGDFTQVTQKQYLTSSFMPTNSTRSLNWNVSASAPQNISGSWDFVLTFTTNPGTAEVIYIGGDLKIMEIPVPSFTRDEWGI